VNTQQYGRRPYGVGLLVSGYDVSMKVTENRTEVGLLTTFINDDRKPDLTCLNALHPEQCLNTMPCLLVPDLNLRRPTWKITLIPSQMVIRH
jgi:hypothetical protein